MPSTRVSPSPTDATELGSVLLVGSCEPFSGKSALVLGLARHLMNKGAQIRFGKPLGTSDEAERKAAGPDSDPSRAPMAETAPTGALVLDADVRFVGDILGVSDWATAGPGPTFVTGPTLTTILPPAVG